MKCALWHPFRLWKSKWQESMGFLDPRLWSEQVRILNDVNTHGASLRRSSSGRTNMTITITEVSGEVMGSSKSDPGRACLEAPLGFPCIHCNSHLGCASVGSTSAPPLCLLYVKLEACACGSTSVLHVSTWRACVQAPEFFCVTLNPCKDPWAPI